MDRSEEQIKKEVLYDLWIGDKLFTDEQEEIIEKEITIRLLGESKWIQKTGTNTCGMDQHG